MSQLHQPLQPIIQHLFQVASLEDVSRQRLESFVEEYPSFGIGHYLLSYKLRSEDPDRFREATQKTCLYFSNPFWLHWLLENSAARNGQSMTASSWTPTGTPVEMPLTMEPPPGETPETAPLSETPAEESFLDAPLPEVVPAEETSIEVASTEDTSMPVEEPAAGEIPEEASVADQLMSRIEEAKSLREALVKINEDLSEEEPIQDEEAPFVLEEQVEAIREPVSPSPDLVFEPYHTIDYFASQGIRLTLDENPGDTLGKQLKSFTDWLKIMRRLPQKDRESVPDRVAEQAVQNFAAHSIESRDVVTETMAEVLVKQGMRDRARVIYEKLSLLNPDKRAYFAGKIEQLNIP